jgi:hypothetical protein
MKRMLLGLLGAALLPGLTRGAEAASSLPETCYLFAYFYHDRQADGLRLAWSRDGYAWEMLNGGESCLRPTVGESKLMRDPCLYRGPDGTFHLLWTTAWAGQTIGYASSPDLIHWSAQRAIPVMAHEPQTVNTWAPEIIWDETARHFSSSGRRRFSDEIPRRRIRTRARTATTAFTRRRRRISPRSRRRGCSTTAALTSLTPRSPATERSG